MNFIMGSSSQIYIELRNKQRYVYASLAEIKPMAQEIFHFSEKFIYISTSVSLKLGQGTKI